MNRVLRRSIRESMSQFLRRLRSNERVFLSCLGNSLGADQSRTRSEDVGHVTIFIVKKDMERLNLVFSIRQGCANQKKIIPIVDRVHQAPTKPTWVLRLALCASQANTTAYLRRLSAGSNVPRTQIPSLVRNMLQIVAATQATQDTLWQIRV